MTVQELSGMKSNLDQQMSGIQEQVKQICSLIVCEQLEPQNTWVADSVTGLIEKVDDFIQGKG